MVNINPSDPNIRSFYISEIPVTQILFEEIMNSNPSAFKGENLPVERISWYDALVFCNLLSLAHGLEPVYFYHRDVHRTDEPIKDVYEWTAGFGGIPNHVAALWNNIEPDPNANGYRLLSHAEWSYLYDKLDNSIFENLEEYAWIYSNSDNQTHPVGTKNKDSNGLYDFLGNVREWRFDDVGNIPERYFNYPTAEREAFYNSLGFKKFNNRDFINVRDHRNFAPTLKNPLIGLRVARF